jgi:hypothetical protein
MSTGYSPSNWARIERDYDDIITEIRKTPNSEPSFVERVIIFDDHTRLKCRECIKYGEIEFFQYDFYDANGNIIIKYHSEPHENPAYQTLTEPFHMHVKENADDLAASKRLPLPEQLRTIDGVLISIANGRYLKYAYIKD